MEICAKKYNSIDCPPYLYTDDKTLYNLSNNEYLGRFYDGYKFHVVKYTKPTPSSGCYLFNLNKKEMVIHCSNNDTCLGKIIQVEYLDENKNILRTKITFKKKF